MTRWLLTRDVLLCGVGLLGIAHETLVATAPREVLLVLFGAMIGLPAFLHADERRRR